MIIYCIVLLWGLLLLYKSSLASEFGCRFIPFVFESFGTLGPFARNFIRDLVSYAKESSSSTFSAPLSISSLSILLQKGNAEMLSQGCVLARAIPLPSEATRRVAR